MGGITIGDGSVIGAGAVITKDVEPYQVVGGVPAKHIRYRFDPDVVSKLLKLQWWQYDEDFIVALPHDDIHAAILMLEARISVTTANRVMSPHHKEAGSDPQRRAVQEFATQIA
jgi:hypothetical protein